MINNLQHSTLESPQRLIPSQITHVHQQPSNRNRRTFLSPEERLRDAQEAWNRILPRANTTTPITQRSTETHRPLVLTTENQLANQPWGDMLQAKPDGATRLFAMNVNGISLDQRGGQFDEICQLTKEVQADILCCQEHNLDITQSQVRSILYDTARQHWNRSRVQFSSTPIPFTNYYKPGGTMIMMVDQVSGRITSQTSDHLGRWSSYTLRGRDSQLFTIISVYQVVTDTPQPGTSTAAAQQQSLLLHLQDPLSSPRRAFKRDLWQFVSDRVKNQEEVLIVGDFNEVFGSEVDGISKLAADFNLVHLMRARHPGSLPATYSRGRKCLDYGLGTTRFSNSLRQCGYDAFGERFSTDHRSYYFDFDTEQLFGNPTQVLSSAAHRTLKSNNVNQVTEYIKLKYEYLASRNAFHRADQLTLVGNRHDFAERLDHDMLQASLDAERRTKKFGRPAWSVALDKARVTVRILRKCLSMHRTRLDHTAILNREIQVHEIEMLLPQTLTDCKTMLRTARADVKRIVSASFKRRDQERNERISALEDSHRKSDKTHAMILRRLRRAEAIKQLFDKIKFARTKGMKKGITIIEIPRHEGADPKTCNDWQIIDVPTSIVHHLQQRNRLHFGQAHGSPFTIDPLEADLGFSGTGPFADDILEGIYDTHQLQDHVRTLVEHMKLTYEMSNLATFPTITRQEFIDKLKVWTETTTTSPSGLHLGHFKALLARHKYSSAPEDDETEEGRVQIPGDPEVENSPSANKKKWDHMQQSLLDFHLNLINYALERGYSYQRWQTIANTMLFKDPGSVKIHRTRVIHIYEADFNLILGLKWRMALYQSEALNQLNDGQYGSRPRRNAIDPVMIEELQFEISRLSRRTFIQTNYDATACYDRIIPNMAMITSRRFGVPQSVTEANVETLRQARFHIRTELGMSDSHYSHSPSNPIYGTGQGSGNSPMIWCFISSLLFDCYEKSAYSASYCNPDQTNWINLSMIGFVDDTNGQVNSFFDPESPITLQQTMDKAAYNASTWAKFLSASGGALELTKCSYHVLHWHFSSSGAPVLINVKSMSQPIKVHNPVTHVDEPLEYLSPTQAHKTLGHYKDPAGLQVMQYNQLKAKSDTITDFLWKTQLTREEAWLYYHACYVPAVTYPLTSSFLSTTQLDNIQRKAMSIIVAKCGFNRHTKREVLYGPIELGGANFKLLSVEQGIRQTTYFIKHWRQDSTVGKLLQCALSWLQLSVGVSYSILDITHTVLPHMESKWLASLRTFLATIQGSLLLDDPQIPQVQRENDEYIMDLILNSNKFKPPEIRKLNYCRLYLQAITISDLTTASGHHLDHGMLRGHPSLQSSTTNWHTINQDRPSEDAWRLWKRANLLWSNPVGTLIQPLGPWLFPIHAQRRQYFAYKHGDNIYIRTADGQYQVLHDLRGTATFRPRITGVRHYRFSRIPVLSVPVDVAPVEDTEKWFVSSPLSSVILRPSPSTQGPFPSFDLFIKHLPAWEYELLRHTKFQAGTQDSIPTVLEQGFRVVSDGSVKHKHGNGSFGWVLSSSRGDRIIHGTGPARGRAVYSYRAEAYGLLSLMRFLIQYREYTKATAAWSGILATDAQSVLDTLHGADRDPQEKEAPIDLDAGRVVLDVLCPEWDVLIEIQAASKLLPNLKLQYVKGHQDRDKRYHQLNLLGQLNVDADAVAGNFITEHGSSRPFAIMSPLTRAHLLFQDGTVTGKYAKHLQEEATTKPLRRYIKKKNGWTEFTMQEVINWEAHAQAMIRSTKKRTHLVKMVHDILPTHGLANKFDNGNRPCPTCQSINEDRDHIFRCEHPTRSAWRQDFLNKLETFLSEKDTSPDLILLLMAALEQWMASGDTATQINPDDYDMELGQVIRQQNVIGWEQIFHGRFGKAWSLKQEQYYRQRDQRRQRRTYTGDQWQVSVILFVWDKWYTLWKQRNQEAHGQDAQTKAAVLQRDLKRRLTMIYQQRSEYEPRLQELLHVTEEVHRRHHAPEVIQNWLSTNEQIFRDSARRFRSRIRSGVQSILPFLTRR